MVQAQAASEKNGKSKNANARVRGVKMAIVDRTALVAAAKKHLPAGSVKDATSNESLIEKLADVWEALDEADESVAIVCGDCGGKGPASEPVCPFCGASDEDPADKELPTGDAEPIAATEITAPAQVLGTTAPEPKASKKKVAPPPALPDNATANAIKSAALAKKEAPVIHEGIVVHTVADLDSAVRDIRLLKESAAASLWNLGHRLKDVFDGNLWKLRTDDKGKSTHKDWQTFCRVELGFDDSEATYKWMSIAGSIDKQTAELVGRVKLEKLLRAPDEDRDGLLDQIKESALKGKPITTKAVEELVMAARKKRGTTGPRETGRDKKTNAATTAAAAKRAAAREAKAAQAKVTVAVLLKTMSGMMFKADGGKYNVENAKPAKRLADEPWAPIDLENGVTGILKLVERKDGIGFQLRFKRDEE